MNDLMLLSRSPHPTRRFGRVLFSGFVAALAALGATASPAAQDATHIVYDGGSGAGEGTHIVFVTGDEEYRSEESMPQMAKILSARHGFKCTVLFAINKETGEIDPQTTDNIPGLEALESADLMVLFIRFRNLPDDQMKRIMDYTNSGKPIFAIRTATHPFQFDQESDSAYKKWTWKGGEIEGGYGRHVLGETWVSHYGKHKQESTRGLPAHNMTDHPVLRNWTDVWGPSDVYGLTTLPEGTEHLVMGVVLTGMEPTDPPRPDREVTPVVWTREYVGATGNRTQTVTSTMGHAGDFQSEGFRRVFVNTCYWLSGLDVPEQADVELVGTYDPAPIGFGGHKRGLRPADHALGE